MGYGVGFDNDQYIALQSKHIMERIRHFDNKLYLELGGKLFDDYHASRVLPGFQPDSKVKMLMSLREEAEIVIVINAVDIEKNKVRGDLGITYDLDALRLIDAFREIELYVGSVVITQYAGQYAADVFKKRLEHLGIPVFVHYPIADYPHNIQHIVSDEGYGRNEYVITSRPLVIVTAPGPGSGKMATCLSQLYHEHKRGISAGYAKFETFPIWNLPLKHPVNLVYEAATADLNDLNMIDAFHLEAYGQMTVNYNRDIEAFPVLNAMFERILGESPYKSPTDMGVNMAGFCIVDDALCCEASKDEIVRRYYKTCCDRLVGRCDDGAVCKIEAVMNQAGVSVSRRRTVAAALEKANLTAQPAAAMELLDGRIITGRSSLLMGPTSAMVLNALKALANVPDDALLIAREVIEPIQALKTGYLGNKNPRLHIDEVLTALAMSAVENPVAKAALDMLGGLRGTEVHSSVVLSARDDATLHKLGVHVTCEPVYQTKRLYRPN